MKSLRTKIILLNCVIAAGVAALVGGLNYVRTVDRTLEAAVSSLASETHLTAVQFQGAYDTVQNEARIVSRTPPIMGMLRSLANNNIDPEDGSTTDLWRNRLATIFSSVMQESPHYTQMRYIGLADNGRELVRVNRTTNGLINVPLDQLQQKGSEDYVQTVMQGRKSFFFSRVTLNREYGAIESEMIPTIRAIMPVVSEGNNPFGLIIINVDYDAMMQQMFSSVDPDKNAFLTNQSGDYVEYNPENNTAHLEYHERFTKKQPEFITKIQTSDLDKAVFIDDEHFTYYRRMNVIKSSNREYVAAVLRVPRNELLADAKQTRRETILLAFALIIVSVFISAFISHKLTVPLVRMTRSIRENKDSSSKLDLPVELKDEIGELARAFEEMIANIARNETEREKMIKALGQSNQELDDFAYVASHDLKAPLRVIDNASRWLEEDLAEHLDEDTKESMDLLRSRVRRMEKLLDDLLEYSRIGRKIDKSDTDIVSGDELAKNILQLLSPPQNFVVQFSPEFTSVTLPRMPIQQVLLNLVSNAIKHHDKAAGNINITVEDQSDRYGFTVSDDGPGVAPEFQDQVFKMFQTLKPRDQVEGSGMGLAMVRKHIEYFGGTITLESEEGKGCAFYFTWPKQQAESR